jgi:hypothetical protein
MSIEEATQVSLCQSKVGIKVILVHFSDTSILILFGHIHMRALTAYLGVLNIMRRALSYVCTSFYLVLI